MPFPPNTLDGDFDFETILDRKVTSVIDAGTTLNLLSSAGPGQPIHQQHSRNQFAGI